MKTSLIASLLLAVPLFAQAAPPMGEGGCNGKMGEGPGAMGGGQFAGSMGGGQGGRMGGGLPHHLRGLNLSESQKDQIFKLMHDQAPQMREKAKAAQQAHEELRQLSQSGQFDEARAKGLIDNATRAHGDMMLMHLKNEQQILTLLTPEQRKQMSEAKDGKKRR